MRKYLRDSETARKMIRWFCRRLGGRGKLDQKYCFQLSPNPPELAQPRLSRSNGGHPQREGTNLGVLVPIWLVLPRCEVTNLCVCVCLICVVSPFSNEAVQIQVSLELKCLESRFAVIRITTGSQRFQIVCFESQGQNPFESLSRRCYFSFF